MRSRRFAPLLAALAASLSLGTVSLTQAAAVHSQDMVTNNFFSHTGSNGSTPWDRIKAAGHQGVTFVGDPSHNLVHVDRLAVRGAR